MGLLDDILSGYTGAGAAGPWGMLYNAPAIPGGLSEQERRAQEAAAIGGMGIDPATLPQRSPFDTPQAPIQMPAWMHGPGMPSPAPSPFAPAPAPNMGTGAPTAAPFSFAGAGSNVVNPSTVVAPPAAPPAFGAGAAPVPFAGGPVTGQPPAGPSTDLSSVNRPAPGAAPGEADGPADPIAVGKYQMPRIGLDSQFDPAEQVPANTAAARPGPAPFSMGGPGLGDRFSKAGTGFMANMDKGPLGALMAGVGSLVTGRSSDPTSIASEKMMPTAQALLNKGAPIEDVKAAVNNPAMMTALLAQYYGKDKWKIVKTGQDGMGAEQYKLMNDQGEFKDIPGGSAGSSAASSGSLGDPTKTGAQYLATVPDAQQRTIVGMVEGRIQPPTSFAASKPYWQTMIRAAQAYDPNFDETSWKSRAKMATELGSSGANTMGGILSNGKSAFEHLATLGDNFVAGGNYNGPDVPGGGAVASVGNYLGNGPLATSTQKGKLTSINDNLLKYGQESTKFYAGSGGGEGERMAALHAVGNSASGNEQAGFMQTEKELMLGRLRQKEDQIRTDMGQSYLDKHPVMTPEFQKTVDRIDSNIAKLRGSAPAGSVASGSVNVGGKAIGWSVK